MTVDERFFRPAEVDLLVGDASLAKKELGWAPKTSFADLVTSKKDHAEVSIMKTNDSISVSNANPANGKNLSQFCAWRCR